VDQEFDSNKLQRKPQEKDEKGNAKDKIGL